MLNNVNIYIQWSFFREVKQQYGGRKRHAPYGDSDTSDLLGDIQKPRSILTAEDRAQIIQQIQIYSIVLLT